MLSSPVPSICNWLECFFIDDHHCCLPVISKMLFSPIIRAHMSDGVAKAKVFQGGSECDNDGRTSVCVSIHRESATPLETHFSGQTWLPVSREGHTAQQEERTFSDIVDHLRQAVGENLCHDCPPKDCTTVKTCSCIRTFLEKVADKEVGQQAMAKLKSIATQMQSDIKLVLPSWTKSSVADEEKQRENREAFERIIPVWSHNFGIMPINFKGQFFLKDFEFTIGPMCTSGIALLMFPTDEDARKALHCLSKRHYTPVRNFAKKKATKAGETPEKAEQTPKKSATPRKKRKVEKTIDSKPVAVVENAGTPSGTNAETQSGTDDNDIEHRVAFADGWIDRNLSLGALCALSHAVSVESSEKLEGNTKARKVKSNPESGASKKAMTNSRPVRPTATSSGKIPSAPIATMKPANDLSRM